MICEDIDLKNLNFYFNFLQSIVVECGDIN
jgi:hypothetical protein